MAKKLELKHVAPYLPYKLKCKVRFLTSKKGIIVRDYYKTCELTSRNISYAYGNWKPILRPLSDLTKEIDHNGKKRYILECCTSISVDEENELRLGKIPDYWEYIINEVKETKGRMVDYLIISTLFEHHVDVFGLINEGLAIDINTLNK